MVGREALLKECCNILTSNGIENAYYEAVWIFQAVLGEANIYNRKTDISDNDEKTVRDMIDRRCHGYPLQYLLGEWEFYGYRIFVGEGVLIPRQDTETLVELASDMYKTAKDITVIDLCSGSGCIGIVLEKQLGCKTYLVEKSEEALKYLKKNLAFHNCKSEIICGDVLDIKTAASIPQADLIVCNPPYLTAEDMQNLQTEVKAEPAEALYGGEDGLEFYRSVTRIWKDRLKAGGRLMFEIGMGQENDVSQIMIQNGFKNVRFRKDLCGVNRVVFGGK